MSPPPNLTSGAIKMQVTLSTRAMHNLSKAERRNIKYYTRFLQCSFKSLTSLLIKDYMYSPFNYIGYTQNTSNICSEANFVVIDVDHTNIPINLRIEQLKAEGLQCILGTTSNATDWYKYRVLIPLDRPVSPTEYRYLVHGIRVNGLIPDMDTASAKPAQKFYSYANSTVLHSFTGSPLIVDDYILEPTQIECKAITTSDDITYLLPEFNRYQYAVKGKRTRSLISAGYRCLQLGMTDTQVEQVITYVNNLFLIPKPHNELKRRVLTFLKTQRN